MISATFLDKLPGRDQLLALLYYVSAVAGLGVTIAVALATLGGQYAAFTEAAERLEKIEHRRDFAGQGNDGRSPAMAGSPFLEGASLTIAGAALQKRFTSAVEAVGGAVLSTQIDLQQPEGSSDRVSLSASCEVDQPGLQKLLYDIEAGMPFLFIDRLLIQPVQQAGDPLTSRMRVQMSLSGQWQQAKQ